MLKAFLYTLAVILVLVLIAVPPVLADETTTMSIEPSSGPVGTVIHVRMTNLPGEGQVAIAFSSKDNIVQTVKPNKWGDFATSFTVGAYPAGTYRVWALCTMDDFSAHFLIEPAVKLDQSSGYVGDSVVASGTGFSGEKEVTVYFDDAKVTTGETDEDGTFGNILFTIPESSRGDHVVKVVDSSGNSASADIVTRQNLTVAPKSGAADSEVTLAGTGFEANASVVVYFDSEAITGALVDEKGSFNTSFRVPVRRSDIYKIKVSDGTSIYYEEFTIIPGVTLTPQSGGVGCFLTVKGSGFRVGLPVTVAYDGDEIASTTVDAQGTFKVDFRVPPGQAGEHRVSASDGANDVAAIYMVESDPPPAPRLILPHLETETANNAYFDWEGISDPSGISYTLVIAADANFSNVLLTKEGLTESEYTLSEDEKLSSNKDACYWRVRGVDGASNVGEWSMPGTFYIGSSITPPRLLQPTDKAKVAGRARFDWEDVDGATAYDLAVASDPDFLKVLLTRGVLNSEYTLSGDEVLPARGIPYYWRVRAVDASNVGEWSSARSFYISASFVLAMPDWTKYSLMGLGLILLCFLCFWLGSRFKNP